MIDIGPIRPTAQPASASSAAPPHKREGIAPALPAVTNNTPHGNTRSVVLQVPKTPIPVQVKDPGFDWLGFGASAAVAIMSALLSYVAIRWQVKRQHGEAVEQHKKTVKADLRLGAYRDFQEALSKYYEQEAPDVRLRLIRNQFEMAVLATDRGEVQYPLPARVLDFGHRLNNYLNHLMPLIFFIERYESMMPGFDIFRTALSCALHDVHRSRVRIDSFLTYWLPMDGRDPSGNPVLLNQRLITKHALEHFDPAAANMIDAIGFTRVWVMDLAVETQNYLLGDYAEKTVKRREPIDPRYFVVTSDPKDRADLDAKFQNTDYMRSASDSQLLATQQVGGKAS